MAQLWVASSSGTTSARNRPAHRPRSAALGEYEQAMFPRSAEAASDGGRLHDLLFGDDTPHGLIAAFAEDRMP